jgi:tRNA pseudouridine55 synthase
MIYNLYKQRGETPLECIQRFAKITPELKGQKMTYLGRLDPLAEGVLLMASGEDVKRREEFLVLDKEYDFVSIFGFATDTYDILGKIVRIEKLKELSDTEVRKVSLVYEGEREQKYPEYSSKLISSRKSFSSESPRVALSGSTRLSSQNFFSKKITIHKINFHGLDALNSKELFGRLLMDISKVTGDFRQHEILILWKEMLFKNPNTDKIFLGRFSAHVSSGTYIRGLVNDFGNTLNCGATTLSIRRTRVGDYKIEDSIK